MKTADKFTLARVILAPVFFAVYVIPVWTGRGYALSVCVMIPLLIAAECTDFLDGYFARRLKEGSDFGKLFDPFADVLLHLSAFACFTLSGYMPPVVFMLIIYREFAMSFMRLAAMQKGVVIAARKGGKAKTAAYVISALYMLSLESAARLGFPAPINSAYRCVALVLCLVCACAAYASFFEYIFHFKSLIGK